MRSYENADVMYSRVHLHRRACLGVVRFNVRSTYPYARCGVRRRLPHTLLSYPQHGE